MKTKSVYYLLLGWLLLIAIIPVAAYGQTDKNTENCNDSVGSKFSWFVDFFYDVKRDYTIYYGKKNLPYVGATLLAAGILANTHADHSVHRFTQEKIRNHKTDHFFKPQEPIGYF